MTEERLSAADWVRAGLRALASSGFTALKADSLAKALGVSRGSFYWHFADIDAFHQAVLQGWREIAYDNIVEELQGSPAQRLRHLLSRAFRADQPLERAVRAWATAQPKVRAMVAECIQYAATLRGMMSAAIENAKPTETGVVLPNHAFVTAGRLFAIEQYPKIMQTLRELSGQGLISRVPRDTWERPDVKALLDEYLPGYTVTASEKNKLFNFIWDMSCGPHALRTALFENINATPAPALREELYRSYDRSLGINAIKARLGID